MTELSDNAPVKAIAAHTADQSTSMSRILLEEHSASFRWLMAYLLTINAGGLLFQKELEKASTLLTLAAGISFFLGIFCSLLIAYLGQKSVQRMMGPITEMGLYWRIVSITGELDLEKQDDLNRRVGEAMAIGKWPRICGFLSFFFFGIGLAITFSELPRI